MIKETDTDPVEPYYESEDKEYVIFNDDCLRVIPTLVDSFDMIFADPPYFLSNGGISCQSGKIVCVDKGEWDKVDNVVSVDDFNRRWLSLCRTRLKENGSIWISGTYHNIFSIAKTLVELGFRILNVVTWAKTNPPPNISCRFFTYSTEFIIWARKSKKIPHKFNYTLMKAINDGKQMTDVWRLPAIGRWEKSCGKHPTQKPLALLTRIILACTAPGDLILDPFAGSSTTGVAAALCGRRYVGAEKEADYAAIGRSRRLELDEPGVREDYIGRLADLQKVSGK